jgi:GNAT superfamily N-acetyltransferase
MQILRMHHRLPPGVESLAAVAAAEGVRNVRLLIENWESGAQRFDQVGAALFAAVDGETTAAIGGVRRETDTDESAMRMHRFYVHPSYRRLGLGSRLAREVMAHALSHASVLTCNARASEAAAPFWEALGFAIADGISYTHIFRAGMNSAA